MPDRVVAIHQPNFFPWLGYFDKLARADVFILMDNTQFPKTGGTWTNRVRVLIDRQPVWVTVPVVRAYHGTRRIAEMEIDDRTPWRTKLLKTLRMGYARAPFVKETYSVVERLIMNPTNRLSDFNELAIVEVAMLLGIETGKLIRGTTLDAGGQATDLLISMVRAVNGTGYLCGGGASGYQEDEKFIACGVKLVYQQFEQPGYPQGGAGEFVPGLSILDALMWCGVAGTRSLLEVRSLSTQKELA